MSNVIRPTVSPEWASSATVNNGSNSTANKVEPTATHKSVGYGYPEQPARNHTNWWMNSVYQWIDYIDAWIQKWGSINKNFAMNDATTTGLVFGYYGGKVSVTVSTQLSAAAGTLTLSDGDGTYKVYFDCADSTVKKLVGSTPTSADVIVPLYSVPVVAGAIDTANIVDLRTINTVRKATLAEVTTGTDTDKYVSPATLQAFATPSATTSVHGKVRLAETADLTAQTGNDVLTAGSLADSEIRATDARYGTTRLADTTSLAARTGDDVLTVANLSDANARASTSLYGVVKQADNTDLLLANRAASTDVLTAASLTQTNMQAAVGSAGIIATANQATVDAAASTTEAVVPATLYAHTKELAAQTLTATKLYTFPHGLSARPRSVDLWLHCLVNVGNFVVGDYIPIPCNMVNPLTNSAGAPIYGHCTKVDATNVYLTLDTNHNMGIHEWNGGDGQNIGTSNFEAFYVVTL